MYRIYLGTIEYTIHNPDGYIVQFWNDGRVGMIEIRIRYDEARKVALGVWQNVSPEIYRHLYIVLVSPTNALTSLNEGVWAIASEKYTK